VQRVLFPRYFALNAILSMGTLLGFAKQHPASAWDSLATIQVKINFIPIYSFSPNAKSNFLIYINQ